jgi:hypothetical protein
MCVWSIFIVLPAHAPALRAAVDAGDQEALRLVHASAPLHRRIAALSSPAPDKDVCLLCATPLWQLRAPTGTVAIAEFGDDAAVLEVYGICDTCVSRHSIAGLQTAIVASCGTRLGVPDLRQLPPLHHVVGHA